MKQLRSIEVKRTKMKYSQIIPPYAVNRLWKELNYQDLHKPEDAPQPEVIDLTPTKRPRMNSVTPTNTASKKKSSENTPTKSLNKAVSNVFKRTPSKLTDEDFLAAFKDDFPDTDLINDI